MRQIDLGMIHMANRTTSSGWCRALNAARLLCHPAYRHEYAWRNISCLRKRTIEWTSYWQRGKRECLPLCSGHLKYTMPSTEPLLRPDESLSSTPAQIPEANAVFPQYLNLPVCITRIFTAVNKFPKSWDVWNDQYSPCKHGCQHWRGLHHQDSVPSTWGQPSRLSLICYTETKLGTTEWRLPTWISAWRSTLTCRGSVDKYRQRKCILKEQTSWRLRYHNISHLHRKT